MTLKELLDKGKDYILDLLRDDEQYYRGLGTLFLSNSNVGDLLWDPYAFSKRHENNEQNLALVMGSYIHTKILEPHKLDDFRIINASTRNTKIYKEESGDDFCLLQKEKYDADDMVSAILTRDRLHSLIYQEGAEYEVPNIIEFHGNWWKGKADIVAPDAIYDIKTTQDIHKFHVSASKFNYDSQAYLYSTMFNRPFYFIVIDKNTKVPGLFSCSDEFLYEGREKLMKASDSYSENFVLGLFDPEQHLIEKMLYPLKKGK